MPSKLWLLALVFRQRLIGRPLVYVPLLATGLLGGRQLIEEHAECGLEKLVCVSDVLGLDNPILLSLLAFCCRVPGTF